MLRLFLRRASSLPHSSGLLCLLGQIESPIQHAEHRPLPSVQDLYREANAGFPVKGFTATWEEGRPTVLPTRNADKNRGFLAYERKPLPYRCEGDSGIGEMGRSRHRPTTSKMPGFIRGWRTGASHCSIGEGKGAGREGGRENAVVVPG